MNGSASRYWHTFGINIHCQDEGGSGVSDPVDTMVPAACWPSTSSSLKPCASVFSCGLLWPKLLPNGSNSFRAAFEFSDSPVLVVVVVVHLLHLLMNVLDRCCGCSEGACGRVLNRLLTFRSRCTYRIFISLHNFQVTHCAWIILCMPPPFSVFVTFVSYLRTGSDLDK